MREKASRQYRWQQRKRAEGLCTSCGDPALPRKERCFRHHALRLLARAGLRPGSKSGLARRELIVSWLGGLYKSFRYGQPTLRWEATAEAEWDADGYSRVRGARERFVGVARSVVRMGDKDVQ